MPIDPARLARIRARLLAAAALTTTAAGCAKPIINDRHTPPEETINEPPREEQHPINDRMNEPPATPAPEPTQAAPDTTAPDTSKPTTHHVNTPKPSDGGNKLTPPPPGQTINTAPTPH
ncbi:hypothetical protein [Polyangium sp. y55x31]|uniref:hypothetical protein n=1 Tax=Polyangium sp. y55x31 TaxID=3042688 RepID=UPI0024826C5A|nr:hypothetical protein [Polyangium sp. y55x31]MDI1479624.1 hypothetical protein [Polyangium sp. y55x31]